MSAWHKVCNLADVPDGAKYPAYVDDYDVLVVNVGGKLYAIEDCCSHQDFPLAHGKLVGCKIKCKAHGAEFDLATGKALCAPAFSPIKVFKLEVRDDEVFVSL